ncbi:DUF2273 domain-containing protein [Selenomonas sp. F0473]|uniref:DUF2273 domain-containing protein n=1 Tax=Selenomonas sp. F0473 TaxID=999423 RepID=UPI00029E93C2|nr:DUF2273 domain-containing protein [Selenomonas sp. F0473]EKU71524.1 hypothetical protein HMPREF9161_00209 [Selenomonas sp. F0473]
MKEQIIRFLQEEWQNNRGRSMGLLLGAAFGIAVLVFGFWRTVFFIACALLGMCIGRWIERRGTWAGMRADMMESAFMQRLFRRIR